MFSICVPKKKKSPTSTVSASSSRRRRDCAGVAVPRPTAVASSACLLIVPARATSSASSGTQHFCSSATWPVGPLPVSTLRNEVVRSSLWPDTLFRRASFFGSSETLLRRASLLASSGSAASPWPRAASAVALVRQRGQLQVWMSEAMPPSPM